MMALTHITFSVAATTLVLGTANPLSLGIAAISCLLPDIDTSHSILGRFFLPVSSWLEKEYPHRTVTHSFVASAIFTLVTYPTVLLWGTQTWQALSLGYFTGWFADVFTKSGVAAFYPNPARLVIPGNPRLRLSTGSRAELFILAILVSVAVLSIYINSSGGILRSFNQTLGIPSGAVEIVSNEISEYLLIAKVSGRSTATQEQVRAEFEVVKPMTLSDLLVRDRNAELYRVGTTQECQIFANRILITRAGKIKPIIRKIQLQEQEVTEALATVPTGERTYISGTLTLEDAEDLILPTYADHFDALTLQPGRDIMIVRLESASPAEVIRLIGEYYATGSLIIRTVKVL